MIVRFPDVPNVDGPLNIPRPAAFLLGSYDPKTGSHGAWYEETARYLDRYVGAVFYGVSVEFQQEFIRWYFHWLDRCDIGVVWLEGRRGDSWSQFEVGYLFGAHARTGKPEVLVGIAPGQDNLRRSLEIVIDHLRLELRIYEDLSAMIHQARVVAMRIR
jgi:hypothetical protein